MLSYRHAFHAGNHADVLKHWLLVELAEYLNQKDKPYWYIDTHAGAGYYALDSEYAQKNAEFDTGVGRLWQRSDAPATLARYLDIVRSANPDGTLRHYPGSPGFAREVLRPDDRLRLFELHPTDYVHLADNFKQEKRARVEKADGFALLKSLLPPAPRRALTLIDPPYEDKKDYRRVVDTLEDALKRFPGGVYAVWYPLLQRAEVREMKKQLAKLPAKGWLDVELAVRTPSADGFGMHGSGLFVLNPPWTLPERIKATLPYLVKTLAEDKGAAFKLDYQIA
ncbi:23S rRNA (adenine(2030)-N(6))-methyltransferase RlmJ [Crenobacter cavernae]|uniref:Ribosomal RNA large subunit methyltransferase J n=1 Tax=Crenobacter cavernae TaxID=2290923 RepID=A0A345Y7P3_9NEIS|nr:23S rRNA (adenine(2030)-N(6))-methyltransferase RlmJ [Crenobacter cavernae]AXK39945.1 23S rRNA (adenine(2030)-N(6))-methyltransferase RlmJ [Crenobacter cavernae]